VSVIGGTLFFFGNLNVEIKGGLRNAWPEMPGAIWWIMRRTLRGGMKDGGGLLDVMRRGD